MTLYIECRYQYMQFYIVPGAIYQEMVTIVTNAKFLYCISRSGAPLLYTALQKSNFLPNKIGYVDCRYIYIQFYIVPGEIYHEMKNCNERQFLMLHILIGGPLCSILLLQKSNFHPNMI